MIGKSVRVVEAKNKSLVGIEGSIVDESKNTFTVETEKGRKKMLKEQISLETTCKGKKVVIDGRFLLKRPEERIKTKVSG
ncbi:ribonuclease P protein subunit [Candidatus Woesearchaeota archaeon]|nr:ribonuclease P protein subunit [Candidatus Woesearchaeota archaeon]